MKWHIQSAGDFYDHGEASVIYYDPRSGGTHLISQFAAHLLQKIAAHPLSTEQIMEAVSADIDAEDSPDLQTAVPDILSRLADLDIIQCQ